jgi:dye decolorizing peroxidase
VNDTASGNALPTIAGREIPFYGEHMPGIEEDIQAVTKLITFELNEDTTKDDMYRWMRLLTLDISAMAEGAPVLGHPSPGLEKGPSGFSAYVGFGPSMFAKLGLEEEMPEGFGKLPEFPGDALQEEYSGGDVIIHVSADDPVVLSQRSRLLIRNSLPFATIKSVQDGFANVPEPNKEQGSVEHRNLFGQIDGTVNPVLGSEDFDNVVWLDEDAPSWAEDGTILLVRRIAMLMESWDSLGTREKEESIGRTLDDGSLLDEKPEDSHVSLAQPENENERIFRRPFSYEEDPKADGTTDAGLLFLTYQENIYEQFVPIQERLAASDRLNLWIQHVGSSEWVIPGGVSAEGEVIAGDLFK